MTPASDALKKKLRLQDIELNIYREIGRLVSFRRDFTAFLDNLMDYVLKAMETDSATIYLADEAKKELVFAVVKGQAAGDLKGRRMPMDKGIAGYVATSGKPYIAKDLGKEKKWLQSGARQRNMMAVPLKVKRKTVGVIAVIDKKNRREFTKFDLRMLSSLANHFSIIIERRELFIELEDRVRRFSTLNEVFTLINSTLDEKLIKEGAIEAITKLMDAEAGSLLLVDKEKGDLYFEVALGEKGKEVKTIRLNMGEGIAGWVAKYGRPLIVDDVTKDKRFQSRVDRTSQFITRNILCVPVKIKGKTIGVLQAINKKGGAFMKKDRELFEVFSNQVAIALDNARLYEEIRLTFYSTSEALADAIEKRDPYTGGHTKRVLMYSLAIAKELQVAEKMFENLKLSAVLHDIGKIGIDDAILRKNAPLDNKEFEVMKTHPGVGADILNRIALLKDILPGILYHHERVDGKGYPTGLKDGRIHIMGRIIAVADTFDAMTTTRPYRKGLPKEDAIAEIKRFSGIQFDKDVVGAFLRAFDKGEIDKILNAAGEEN